MVINKFKKDYSVLPVLILTAILLLIPFSLTCNSSQRQFTIWIGGSPEEINFWETIVKEFENEYHYNLQLVRQLTYTDQRRQALVVSPE